MLNYKKNYGKYIAAVLAVLFLFAYVVHHIQVLSERLDNENHMLVEQQVKAISQTFESSVGFAKSRIRIIANNLSMSMRSSELQNHKYVLALQLENSPFSFFEYVREDGTNELSDGTRLDASDRVYYKEAMQGRSGVWTNFKPALAKEVLLAYYSPLHFENKPVGVLVGVVGGNSLNTLLRQEFFGVPCYSILCDSQGRIITSNGEHTLAQNINEYLRTRGITEAELNTIHQQMAEKKRNTLRIDNNSNYTLVGISYISDIDCHVLEIVPNSSIATIRNNALFSYYAILAALMLMLILIGILYSYENKMEKALQSAKKELEISTAIGKSYLTLHIIDLATDTAEEYIGNAEINKLIAKQEKASEKIFTAMEKLTKPEWKDKVLSFVDLSTLKERMENQDFLMLDFEGVHYWVRSFFSVVERDEENQVTKLIFVTRVIDKYMKDLEQLNRKSTVDQLTGLLNRRAYEESIKEYKEGELPKDFVLASIDLNGLKNINDTKGHAAGDEMIKGAAACLKHCLTGYGNVYRIGGDEFNAILFVDENKLTEIKKDLETTVRTWEGKLVKELFLACGYASSNEFPEASFKELSDVADKLMYKDKENYYSQKGMDRRRQHYIFDVICNSYTKILRVNLTDDSYTIIRLEEQEINNPNRPEKISQWLQIFGSSSRVHEADREIYLKATKLDKLRAFFKDQGKHYSFYYRRDIKGEFKYVMMEIIAAHDYTDEQQFVYLLVKDIGKKIKGAIE